MSETIEAGRETDALIAEHVMGFHREVAPPDYDKLHGGNEVLVPPGETLATLEQILPRKGPISLGFFVRSRFSTDRSAALEVVDRLTAAGFIVDLHINADLVVASLIGRNAPHDHFAMETASTLPLALCRASLDPAVLSYLAAQQEKPE